MSLDDLSRLADMNPDDGVAAFDYASALDAAGRVADATRLYRQALSRGLPDDLEYRAQVQLGSSLRVLGQAEEAVEVHRLVRSRWPRAIANRLFLALALQDAGRPGEALGEALTGCLLTENDPDIEHYRRALGNYAEETARRGTVRPPLVEQLDLSPHPEGGWFRQTWRSAVSFSPEGYSGPRSAATAIYFLLHPGERSRWHVVRSDELWFWHSGGPLELRTGGAGDEPSAERAVVLGGDLGAGQRPQAIVPGGVWQCAAPAGQAPVLVSCVVAPGFDYADFRLH